jgi:hypothetical protein
MLITLGSDSIVFIDASDMVWKNTSTGRGVLWVVAFASSSASKLFLSMYSTVKPLEKLSILLTRDRYFLRMGSLAIYFFYLSNNYFGVCAKDAPLNPDGC